MLKISLFLCVVVLSVDTKYYKYQDTNCQSPSEITPSSSHATCAAFLKSFKTGCDDAAFGDSCDFTLDTCLSNDYISNSLGFKRVKLECTESTKSPTKSPTDPTCTDKRMNGNETGVDCGGTCPDKCPLDCKTGYDCGANYTHIDNADTVYCDAFPCSTDSDLDTCCQKKAPCFELAAGDGCLPGTVLITNANSTFCADTECESSDRSTCCAPAGNCANFNLCNSTTQYLKSNPAGLLCDSAVCDSSDISKCCDNKASCSQLTCNFNGGLTYKKNFDNIYCANSSCSTDQDSDTCCTDRGSCSSYTCDDAMFLNKSNKDSRFCSGITCVEEDSSYCCDLKGACKRDSFTYSCSTNSLVENPENVYCANITCSSPTDDATCCPPDLVSCDSNACNLDVSVLNTTEKCKGNPCTSLDTQCCLPRKTCVNYLECDAMTEYVNVSAYCADVQCESSDTVKCCISRANCTEYGSCDLATGYLNETNYCLGDECDDSIDADTCCMNRTSCSAFTGCDPSTQKIISSNYCEMDCGDSADAETCCLDLANCTGFGYCGDNQMLNNTAMCASDSCTEVDDVANCCINLASCDSYSCDSSTQVLVANADITYCASTVCVAADDCCEARAMCSNYTGCAVCDLSQEDMYCVGTTCAISDHGTCCMEKVSVLDDCKGGNVEWSVTLSGDIGTDDHNSITDTIASYLGLPCIQVNGSYAADGSNWKSTYQIFVSTDVNKNAVSDLESNLTKPSSIDDLIGDISSNLGGSSVSIVDVKFSSVPFDECSAESGAKGLSTGIIIVIVLAVVLILGALLGLLVYKTKYANTGGAREKVSDVFEM